MLQVLTPAVIEEFRPAVVIFDPMTTLTDVGSEQQAKSVITRLIDFLKMRATSNMFTHQTRAQSIGVVTDVEIPSLFDTWLGLGEREVDDERYHTLLFFKSRGIAHSIRVCEFRLTDSGIRLSPLALGDDRKKLEKRTIIIDQDSLSLSSFTITKFA
jgi:circadian clock protein KaiC